MKVRQAIVVIHGMGEQRPVETLDRFSRVLTPEGATFYSRSDKVAGSFDSRRHLIPRQDVTGPDGTTIPIETQTELYEYHWAHLMQGNRIDDLWPTFRRLLFPAPGIPESLWVLAWLAVAWFGWSSWQTGETIPGWLGVTLFVVGAVTGVGYLLAYVPTGLVAVWLALWAGIGWVGWALADGPLTDLVAGGSVGDVVSALIGGGVAALVGSYVVSRVMPRWITSSFVDVIRYLDTSPRSLASRQAIRSGILDLLRGLHDSGRYQRVVIVAHSLGSYIAYDAITRLWAETGRRHDPPTTGSPSGGVQPAGLADLERAASALASGGSLDDYQAAQHALWGGIRAQGNPWLITDFVSFGSPMYFADRLYTRNRKAFDRLVDRREIVTCPPQNELAAFNNVNGTSRFFSWNDGGVRILHEAAPFAVVRWTNMWFPAVFGFFGDWFGGPLAPLYGPGVRDVPITHNRPGRWAPGVAHALYLSFRRDRRPGSFAGEVAQAVRVVGQPATTGQG